MTSNLESLIGIGWILPDYGLFLDKASDRVASAVGFTNSVKIDLRGKDDKTAKYLVGIAEQNFPKWAFWHILTACPPQDVVSRKLPHRIVGFVAWVVEHSTLPFPDFEATYLFQQTYAKQAISATEKLRLPLFVIILRDGLNLPQSLLLGIDTLPQNALLKEYSLDNLTMLKKDLSRFLDSIEK